MDSNAKRRCGAKNRQGEPCKKAPMKGKSRCRSHGGKSLAGKDSKVYRHGIYSETYTAEEIKSLDYLKERLSSVDDEITLTRIRLLRAQKAEQRAVNDPKTAMEVDEIRRSSGGKNPETNTVMRKADFHLIIDRLLGRLGMLMKVRVELGKAIGDDEFAGKPLPWCDDSPEDKARQVNEALRAMIATERDGSPMDIDNSPSDED
jgi:hypothetical protein